MTALEVGLIICGIICVILSFVFGKNEDTKVVTHEVKTDLSDKQKEEIRIQIDSLVKEELDNINERTEASLDKISNTKILEMNDYAETVINEINRNHNETVFLYDMLNEKAKEVKSTVKDVNLAKKQVEKIQAESTVSTEESMDAQLAATIETKDGNLRDDAKERLSELVRKSSEKGSKGVQRKRNAQADKLDDMMKDERQKEAAQMKKDAEDTAAAMKALLGNQDDSDSENQIKPQKASKSKSNASTQKDTLQSETENAVTKEPVQVNVQFEKGMINHEQILKLFRNGMTNKEIAKELNLGIGEVKLVIDLYKNER